MCFGCVGVEQLELGGRSRRRPKARTVEVAARNPVAAVAIDVNAIAVDREFDYLVKAEQHEAAVPGARVRVRFAGRLVDGVVLDRLPASTHEGKLSYLQRVNGPSVLSEQVLRLARAVATRYAGTLAEVLRDALPARHAEVEKQFLKSQIATAKESSQNTPRDSESAAADWAGYEHSAGLLAALQGQRVRAALTVAPASDPAELIADLTVAHSGNAIIVVPDAADIARFEVSLRQRWGDELALLTAAMPAKERYREFLRIRFGQATVVLGTRNSVFAPIDDALTIVWDDIDESLLEPRAPGWHAREVAALRSQLFNSSLIIAGYATSVETARLTETRWLKHIRPSRDLLHAGPRVITEANARHDQNSPMSRIPGFAWRVLSDGIKQGPVLVQVARTGYLPALACASCASLLTCQSCGGTIEQVEGDDGLFTRRCRICQTQPSSAGCAQCGDTRVRAVRIGSGRTAAELHAAFPDVPVVVSSSADGVKRNVDAEPKIVVATVGAEPVAAGGYQAALFLDAQAQLARSDIRTEEQLMHRWLNALALVKPQAAGGRVAVTAPADHRSVQAIVRGDPMGWARRELEQRIEAGLPPAVRSAVVKGDAEAIQQFLVAAEPGPPIEVSDPLPIQNGATTTTGVILTAPVAKGRTLEEAVRRGLAARSDPRALRVRIDPLSLFGQT